MTIHTLRVDITTHEDTQTHKSGPMCIVKARTHKQTVQTDTQCEGVGVTVSHCVAPTSLPTCVCTGHVLLQKGRERGLRKTEGVKREVGRIEEENKRERKKLTPTPKLKITHI